MRRRSFHSSILDDIQLDTTKTITHLSTTPSNMKKDIQEVIDNGKGYCLISIDSIPLGYITSKSILRTHTKSISNGLPKGIEPEDIAADLFKKFANQPLTEFALKQHIEQDSFICSHDSRLRDRIFKHLRKELDKIEIDWKGEQIEVMWLNSYIIKYTDEEHMAGIEPDFYNLMTEINKMEDSKWKEAKIENLSEHITFKLR